MGYTSEPAPYEILKEDELICMSMAYANETFKEDWDINNQEENDYWETFVK